MAKETGNRCPMCNHDNDCGRLAGQPDGDCWCTDEFFPKEIFEKLPSEPAGKSCICKDCLAKFKDNSKRL